MPKTALQFVFSTENVKVETLEEPIDTRIRPGAAHKLAKAEAEEADASMKWPNVTIPRLSLREVNVGNDLAEANRLKILAAVAAASEEAQKRAAEMKAAREKAQQEAQQRVEALKASHLARGLSSLDPQKRDRLLQFVGQRRAVGGQSSGAGSRQLGHRHRAAAQVRHQQEAARRFQQRQDTTPSSTLPSSVTQGAQTNPSQQPTRQQPTEPTLSQQRSDEAALPATASTLAALQATRSTSNLAQKQVPHREGACANAKPFHAKSQQAVNSMCSTSLAPPKQQPQALASVNHLNLMPKKFTAGREPQASAHRPDAKLPSWMAPRSTTSARPSSGRPSSGGRAAGSSGSARQRSRMRPSTAPIGAAATRTTQTLIV